MDLPFVFDNPETADQPRAPPAAGGAHGRHPNRACPARQPENPAIPERPAYTQARCATTVFALPAILTATPACRGRALSKAEGASRGTCDARSYSGKGCGVPAGSGTWKMFSAFPIAV
jgi:hypothetical protein